MNDKIVVVGSQFCATFPVELTVIKKALSCSAGDFVVNGVDGNLLFNVKGIFSCRLAKRILIDPLGTPLLTMTNKIWHVNSRWKVFRGDSTESNDLLFTAKRSSFFQLFKTKVNVFMAKNIDEKSSDFKIKGNFFDRSCTIYIGESNSSVAQISRKYTVSNILLGKDKFVVTVNPNVDCAFIAALIVILDAIHRDRYND